MRIHDLGDDKQAGGMLRVGSPSDQPFGAWRDMTVTFLGFMTIPTGERDAWSFSLLFTDRADHLSDTRHRLRLASQ